jgi:hypothetical protein
MLNFGAKPLNLQDYMCKQIPLSLVTNNDFCVTPNNYGTSSDEKQVTKITFLDVLYGRVECQGRIKVLAWRSRIPPVRNHICSCEIQKPQSMATT